MHKKKSEVTHKNVIYLLNAPILSAYGQYQFSGPLSAEQAKAMLESGFESAIGHASTAQMIEQLLGIPIPVERQSIHLSIGDKAVVFRLTRRLPEGMVIHCVEQLKEFPYEFSLLERLA